jgi:DNA-binding response OmpR family regulator
MRERRRSAILVVDDDVGFHTFAAALLGQAGYDVHAVERGQDALQAARRTQPQLVVLDVRLPDLCGYEVCRQLRDEFGNALPILFVSGERIESMDRAAGLLIGADDYLVKPFASDEFLARVRRLVSRASAATHEANGREHDLTIREREVLRLLAEGLGPGEIARRLVISPKTVGHHVEHIYGKLSVTTRGQAVAAAYRKNLVAGDVERTS